MVPRRPVAGRSSSSPAAVGPSTAAGAARSRDQPSGRSTPGESPPGAVKAKRGRKQGLVSEAPSTQSGSAEDGAASKGLGNREVIAPVSDSRVGGEASRALSKVRHGWARPQAPPSIAQQPQVTGQREVHRALVTGGGITAGSSMAPSQIGTGTGCCRTTDQRVGRDSRTQDREARPPRGCRASRGDRRASSHRSRSNRRSRQRSSSGESVAGRCCDSPVRGSSSQGSASRSVSGGSPDRRCRSFSGDSYGRKGQDAGSHRPHRESPGEVRGERCYDDGLPRFASSVHRSLDVGSAGRRRPQDGGDFQTASPGPSHGGVRVAAPGSAAPRGLAGESHSTPHSGDLLEGLKSFLTSWSSGSDRGASFSKVWLPGPSGLGTGEKLITGQAGSSTGEVMAASSASCYEGADFMKEVKARLVWFGPNPSDEVVHQVMRLLSAENQDARNYEYQLWSLGGAVDEPAIPTDPLPAEELASGHSSVSLCPPFSPKMKNPLVLLWSFNFFGFSYGTGFMYQFPASSLQHNYPDQNAASAANSFQNRRNWCQFTVTRTVTCQVQNGSETVVQRVYQSCRWPGPCANLV
ncbi:collagen alpha-1(XXVI) chain isoform X2, partial [Pelobates cultripes]